MKLRNLVAAPVLLAASAIAQETPAVAGGAAEPGCLGSGGIMGILPIVAMVAIFYFLIIRPQQKQAKKVAEMRGSLKIGDNVVISGGIHGVITNLKSDLITVRIADAVKIDVERSALTVIGEVAPAECKTC
jgi:preprotein translocase subunit YajC